MFLGPIWGHQFIRCNNATSTCQLQLNVSGLLLVRCKECSCFTVACLVACLFVGCWWIELYWETCSDSSLLINVFCTENKTLTKAPWWKRRMPWCGPCRQWHGTRPLQSSRATGEGCTDEHYVGLCVAHRPSTAKLSRKLACHHQAQKKKLFNQEA